MELLPEREREDAIRFHAFMLSMSHPVTLPTRHECTYCGTRLRAGATVWMKQPNQARFKETGQLMGAHWCNQCYQERMRCATVQMNGVPADEAWSMTKTRHVVGVGYEICNGRWYFNPDELLVDQ